MATRKRIKGQTKQGHKEKDKRTDNTMATRKRIKGQTKQWPQGKG